IGVGAADLGATDPWAIDRRATDARALGVPAAHAAATDARELNRPSHGTPRLRPVPLWLNLVLTATAAAAVWVAGTRLAREADAISKRTGAGEAFVGLILLGAIVSLPELSTSITASWMGNPSFAVSTLVGGIAAVMVALAVVDAIARDQPVSSDVRHPIVLFQGVLTVLFLVV